MTVVPAARWGGRSCAAGLLVVLLLACWMASTSAAPVVAGEWRNGRAARYTSVGSGGDRWVLSSSALPRNALVAADCLQAPVM
jgi:hypothetical protein